MDGKALTKGIPQLKPHIIFTPILYVNQSKKSEAGIAALFSFFAKIITFPLNDYFPYNSSIF